jgi:hypothetical protein
MKTSIATATPIFTILMLISAVATANTDLQIPKLEEDVTIIDEYYGRVNSSHPLYWGEHRYFLSTNMTGVFYYQLGGAHNHATHHTIWNEPIYIEKLTNVEYIEWTNTTGQLLVHWNSTHVYFSNGQDEWIPNRLCEICNGSMHGYEFSRHSTAIYWQCSNCRLIIGEILKIPDQ